MRVGRVLGFVVFAAVATGCNDNGVVGMPGDIAVSPDSIDYGRTQEQTAFEQVVMITNKGEHPINVTSITLDNPNFVIEGELPSIEAPWTLRGHEFRHVTVSFFPTVLGPVEGTL